jgi:hypothetical protein
MMMTGTITIDHCGRTTAASVVAFAIRWTGELPVDREVTWAVRVASEDVSGQVELGHQRSGGRTSQYVLDVSTGRRQEVSADADLQDNEITVRFPAEVVGLAVEWPTWRAVIAVDGEDVTSLAVPV